MRLATWFAAAFSPLTAVLLLGGASPALGSGSANIDHVENAHGTEQVLFSIAGLADGTTPDLSSVAVTVDGLPVDAEAALASGSAERVDRVAVLALDVSNSMQGSAFAEAKRAALTFVNQTPVDVAIGLVTFAGTVDTVQRPTTGRADLRARLDSLRLSQETHLNEGILAALSAAGADGQRRLLVLSDGRDTTGSRLFEVTSAIRHSGARVDVVSLGQSVDDQSALAKIARAGEGTLVRADDPTALSALFAEEAQALASQILVTFAVPTPQANSDAELTVSLAADGTTYADDAFITLGDAAAATKPDVDPATTPLAVPESGFVVSKALLLVGVAALALGLMLGLAYLFGVFRGTEDITLERRLAGYGRGSAARTAKRGEPVNVKQSAIALAQKTLSGGYEAKLDKKLDAAGLSLKPAEWVLTHVGLAIGAAFVGFMLSGGGVILTVVLFFAGIVLPWVYLGFKQTRRVKAFNAQLAETLQLMSGGLSAGLSLAQSVDTIVREGTEPVAGEFRRALIEARLGVDIEDALDGVAARMGSADFEWVVMAIRIQREVGGNLAELLITVAATLREREYLRRQVQTLSAEGRLSAWILGALPPVFLLYLVLTRGDYIAPLFHSPLGWMMLGFSAILMTVGAFWMSKVVKVEV